MTKHYCDRCNKEVHRTSQIRIENNSISLFDYSYYEICESCKHQVKKYLNNRKSEVENHE